MVQQTQNTDVYWLTSLLGDTKFGVCVLKYISCTIVHACNKIVQYMVFDPPSVLHNIIEGGSEIKSLVHIQMHDKYIHLRS